MTIKHPEISGVISCHKFSVIVISIKMAMQDERPDYLTVLRQVEISLNSGDFPPFNLKPLQVNCLEYILKGQDVIGVLPTGFGKLLMFHLLPHFLPVKKTRNTVIVVCQCACWKGPR